MGLERPKVVIGFPDSFSIGPLWKLNGKVGQTFRNEWLYEHINYENDDYEYETKFANTLREIEDIPGKFLSTYGMAIMLMKKPDYGFFCIYYGINQMMFIL